MVHKFVDLIEFEGTAATHHVDKATSNASVYVQDEVSLLGCGYLLNTKRKLEDLRFAKMLQGIFFHEFDTHVWIRLALDAVPNAHNQDVVLFAVIDKLLGCQPLSAASANIFAASSRAPPNRGPMHRSPEHKDEIKSLPARAATTVL